MDCRALLGVLGLLGVTPAAAQTAIDRVDPARIERDNLPPAAPAKVEAPTLERGVPAGASAAGLGDVAVGAVVIEGLQELRPADFMDIVARYVGRTVSAAELAQLAEAIGARARARGYVFASASIPAQRLSAGILTVRYDPGVLDAIRLEGGENAAVRAALLPLVGRPARLDDVERRLLIAGDVDGVAIRRSRYLREGARGVLLVSIAETRLRVRATLENDSTAPIGPVQLRIDADLTRLIAADDALGLTYVATPFEPSELQFVRARYARRVSPIGTEVALTGSIAATRPGAYLTPLDLAGDSWFASLSVLQPLHRRRTGSLWLTGSLDLRDTEQRRAGLRRRHDRLFVLRAGLTGNASLAGGTLRGNAAVAHGIDGFDATRAGDPLASRDDADGTFTSLVGWSDWTRPLPAHFSLRIGAQAQIASQPLLIAEEIGLGGGAFLRGYDYSERSGDQGYMGVAEVRYDWRNPLGLGRKAQLYGFVDGGWVTNLRGGFGGGALASGGGGVRADVSPTIDAAFEVAVPLSDPRYETGNRRPRLNFRILKVF